MESAAALSGRYSKQWLAGLMFAVTMCARATYAPNSDSVVDPAKLRRFNELVHRIASFTYAVAKGDAHRYPDEVFIHIVVDELASLGVDMAALKSMMGSISDSE